jgi:hypothetical protein
MHFSDSFNISPVNSREQFRVRIRLPDNSMNSRCMTKNFRINDSELDSFFDLVLGILIAIGFQDVQVFEQCEIFNDVFYVD